MLGVGLGQPSGTDCVTTTTVNTAAGTTAQETGNFDPAQSAPFPVGLGIGVPQANGSGCRTTVSTSATPASAPQLMASVEEGRYCVIVFDVVGLLDPITFTVEVVQP